MARAARGRLLLLLPLAFLVASGATAALHDAPAPRPSSTSSTAPAPRSSSSISAAPESPPPLPLPRQPNQRHGRHAAGPALPPALSPDIMPVLPSPAEDGAGPAPDAGEPTIPSSPSPPNPDALEPDSALAPFGSAPAVAAQSRAAPRAAVASALPLLGLLLAVSWLLLLAAV